jgi:hypothetical protein
MAASIVVLAVGDVRSRADAPKKGNPASKVKEVNGLAEAYVLMAGANHDYDGHRVKSMGKIKEAINQLDKSILKTGDNGEKVVATKDEIASRRAKFVAEHQGVHHESQEFADLQMREALTLLAQVRADLPKKHGKAHQHVNAAIEQAEIALKIH